MRMAIGWLIAVLLMLGLLTLGVRLIERHLAFFPSEGEQQTPKAYGIAFTAHRISTLDGERLNLWHLPRPTPRARVVYFHGNGGNLSLWADVFATLWHQNFDVVAVDYRGYGLSTGTPSERGLY